MPVPHRVSGRLLGALAVLAWVSVVTLVIPVLIRSVYAGTLAPRLLGGLITGQAEHPVEHYLTLWRQWAPGLTLGGLGVAGIGWLLWTLRARWVAAVRHAVRDAPVVGVLDVVAIAGVLGLVAGLGESGARMLRLALTQDPREAPAIDALWMAPLASGLLAALAGLLLAGVTRAWRGLSIRVPMVVIGFPAALGVLASVRLGLHRYAAMALAVGIAVALARRASASGETWRRASRRAALWCLGGVLVLAIVMRGAAFLREHVAMDAAPSAAPGSPNVLILILDTVRASSMGLYGSARATTPEIEHWAASGTVFDRAIAPSPWTLPSHASLFTGRLPPELGTDFDRPLDGAFPTLAEVLGRAGYATGGFVANTVYASRASGLDRGFDTYRDHPVSVEALLASSRWTRQLTQAVRTRLGHRGLLERKTAAEVNNEFLDWVPKDGQPFLAFLNYFDAHEPYETHPPFDRLFSDHPPQFWRVAAWGRAGSEEAMQELQNAYDSGIAYMDHQVGVLLRSLEAQGILEHTLVVLASDHGEHFGEHGGITSHANSLYLPLLHVPLVLSYPGRIPPARRIADPVGLEDVAATILELVDVPIEGELSGISLSRYWGPGMVDTLSLPVAPRAILSTLTPNTFANPRDPISRGPMQSLVLGSRHYIRNGDGREELYDIHTDPLELDDLSREPESAGELSRFRGLLAKMLAPLPHRQP